MKLPIRVIVVVLGCLAVLAAAPAANDPPRFSDWFTPVNLGPVINTPSDEGCPTISKSGLSLFFRTNRTDLPGYQGGADIFVAQRDSLEEPWGTPVNLGAKINSPSNEFCTALSPDEHWMIFVSDRLVDGVNKMQDLWITHRQNRRDDFGWEPATNLGSILNSERHDNAPRYFEDPMTGELLLLFAGGRPTGGPISGDIWVARALDDRKDLFDTPTLVPEPFSVPIYNDSHPLMRKDGLEFFFVSNRTGSTDIWVSTRERMEDPWSAPVNLETLNSPVSSDFRPTLSFDGRMLIFASYRPGGFGDADLYVSTRARLKERP